MKDKISAKGLIYIALAVLFFTSMEPVTKILGNTGVGSAEMTFMRFAIGGIALLIPTIVMLKKQHIRVTIKMLVTFLIMGSAGVALSMLLLQYAVAVMPPANAAIIFSCNPVFTAVFAALILNESFTPKKLIAIVLCLVGIGLCADFGAGGNLHGVVLSVSAAVLFSLYGVFGKKFLKDYNAIIQNCISFLSGALVLLAVILCKGLNPIGGVTLSNLGLLIYLGLGVSCLGYIFYFLAMKESSASQAATVFAVKPVLAPVFSYVLLGTPFNKIVLLAMVFIFAGSYINLKK